MNFVKFIFLPGSLRSAGFKNLSLYSVWYNVWAMKYLSIVVILSIAFFLNLLKPTRIWAITDPLTEPNNPVGIHILSEKDLKDASELVNTGGDWGYVTLVIRSNETDSKRWQKVFDEARRLHLIPIVRIASKQLDGGWEKPSIDEVDGWVSFLSSLNWVVQNRYVVIGNEPNHAKEWGGEVNPEEYTDYLVSFSQKLKEASEDFFVLQAGLDASAPTDNLHMSEAEFIKRMLNHKQDLFDYIDGWTSHSYPNPNFSGSENAEGRGTVKTFEWELNYLKSLGVQKDLPVFITETGWAHNGDNGALGFYKPQIIGQKLIKAYESAWNDKKIVAVTPFVLDYQAKPFDVFSWKKKDGDFYEFYHNIKDMAKSQGKPVQIVSSEVISFLLPPVLRKVDSDRLYGLVNLKNTGQSIWKVGETVSLTLRGKEVDVEPVSLLSNIEPGETTLALYEFAS